LLATLGMTGSSRLEEFSPSSSSAAIRCFGDVDVVGLDSWVMASLRMENPVSRALVSLLQGSK